MDKEHMESLHAGVAEMRSVASRLLLWADDLEKSFQDKKTDEGKVKGDGNVDCKGSCLLTLPEVRAILAEKCAAGYGKQVKALIASFGAATLGGVPCERYRELAAAAGTLGDGIGDSVSDGDADAG